MRKATIEGIVAAAACLLAVGNNVLGQNEFFDDFCYEHPTEDVKFGDFGWWARVGPGGPGCPGTWTVDDRVLFRTEGDTVMMRLAAGTDGSCAGTTQSEVRTLATPYFHLGTYAARVRFTNLPLIGEPVQPSVQTFFLISDYASTSGTLDYSECDFEYLPRDVWSHDCQSRPAEQPHGLYMHTWESDCCSADDCDHTDRITCGETCDSQGGFEHRRTFEQRDQGDVWYTYLVQVDLTEVRYLIDDTEIAVHDGEYVPEPDSKLRITFNHWFEDEALAASGLEQVYPMDVDWVYHSEDPNLTGTEVNARVAAFEASGLNRLDTFLGQAGDLSISIEPAEAVLAGAQWRIDGGEWHDSGSTVTLMGGVHLVEFSTVDGWCRPASEEVPVNAHDVTALVRDYTPCPDAPFDAVLEWSWTTTTDLPDSLNVITTPTVLDVDGNGIPDIVFATTTNTSGFDCATGHLRVLRGNNGSELLTVTSEEVMAAACPAVGDIDGDGLPELVTAWGSSSHLIAFEHDGATKWISAEVEELCATGPALADLDGDGNPEVVFGRQVLDNLGGLLWTGSGSRGSQPPSSTALSLAADINLDGSLDVVAGNTVYEPSGAVLWHQPSAIDGFSAVADFDGDAVPEIVLVNESLWLLESDGAITWGPIAIPGSGRGGAPTIADFDGDGAPEIGVCKSVYSVFEGDGTLKWQRAVNDSASVGSASAFDFNSDGAAEIVHRDHFSWRIINGSDGSVLWTTPLSSCTWWEYPVIADVDADGVAEIIVGANNNCGLGSDRGIFVYGPAQGTWACARPVWNQHSYHITNVNDDGTIPTLESNSFATFNTYRANRTCCPWDCEAIPNGNVGTVDLLALLAQWGGPGTCDFDGGGANVTDLLQMLAAWGGCD